MASLIASSQGLLQQVLGLKTLEELMAMLGVEASEYWKTHTHLSKPGKGTHSIGDQSIEGLIVNAICPTLYAYGKARGQYELQERAIEWLEGMAPENNRLTRRWKSIGISPKNAGESQGLIHLNRLYCTPRRCLDCAIGVKLLKTI